MAKKGFVKSVRREMEGPHGCVFETGQFRPVIITLTPPSLIEVKLKGLRRSYFVTADRLYHALVKGSLAGGQE